MIVITKLIGIVIVLVAFVASTTLATTAYAAPKPTPKPGWGFGDKNHVHTGPPGLSVRTTVSNSVNLSANTGGNKTGNNSQTMTGDANILLTISNVFSHLFGN